MNVLRRIHALYGILVFVVLFSIFFPLFLVPIFSPSRSSLTGILNRWWARSFFFLLGFAWKVEYRFKPERGKQYIFCPNHFSYLDIPAMGLNPINTIFVGKSSMEKVPVFGFMYRRLHITVDRDKLKSRYSTLVRSLQALEEGKSLVIFPEGGILSQDPPRMARFKDGPFRAGISKQISIVPVTIPHNWIILPDGTLDLRLKTLRIVFHEPVETVGLTLDDVDMLKEKVFTVIEEELKKGNAGYVVPGQPYRPEQDMSAKALMKNNA